jgi:hypothetical protein
MGKLDELFRHEIEGSNVGSARRKEELKQLQSKTLETLRRDFEGEFRNIGMEGGSQMQERVSESVTRLRGRIQNIQSSLVDTKGVVRELFANIQQDLNAKGSQIKKVILSHGKDDCESKIEALKADAKTTHENNLHALLSLRKRSESASRSTRIRASCEGGRTPNFQASCSS